MVGGLVGGLVGAAVVTLVTKRMLTASQAAAAEEWEAHNYFSTCTRCCKRSKKRIAGVPDDNTVGQPPSNPEPSKKPTSGGGAPVKVSAAGPSPPPDNLSPKPTKAELDSYAATVARLWAIDEPYRLDPDNGYELDNQAKAGDRPSISGDRATRPLFHKVNEARLFSNPCTKSFYALLDNYERKDNIAEKVTDQQKSEMDDFMRRLMKTPHMQYIHKVLVSWGKADPKYSKFSARVFELWFTCYSMPGPHGPKVTSGFEHVFVGEEKNRPGKPSKIIDLHNWIQFWREEKSGRLNYRGFVGTLNGEDRRVVSVRLDFADDHAEVEPKNISTFLVGSSVAFEFAMLTCAFVGFGGDSKTAGIWLGDTGPLQVTTYKWDSPTGPLIRAAYISNEQSSKQRKRSSSAFRHGSM